MKSIIIFALLSLKLLSLEVSNGKSILIPVNESKGFLVLQDRNLSILPHPLDPNKGFAILPIDYYTPPQKITAHHQTDAQTQPIEITVTQALYPTETLQVDPAKVSPPEDALERIAQEKAEAEAIYNTVTPARYWNKPFILPMESNITSAYGSQRTYNGSLKSYHSGVDFRAKTPLPILAANEGVVVLVKDRYYAGGTVIIDHGEGLYTCYFHMSRFDVKRGDRVMRGQNIGLSGATGRITGPHLHFAMMVGGIQTDPLDLLAQIETLFLPSSRIAQNP